MYWRPDDGSVQRPDWPPAPARAAGQGLSGWAIAGIVLATVLAVAGLVVVAGVILLFLALNSWGSNK